MIDHELIPYKGYTIKLKYREETNDYVYSFEVRRSVGGKAPRRATALRQAKSEIDIMTAMRNATQ